VGRVLSLRIAAEQEVYFSKTSHYLKSKRNLRGAFTDEELYNSESFATIAK
jgi:hypothetical protein